MVYLVYLVGLLIAIGAFYIFFIKATPQQIRQAIKFILATIYIFILLFFALTGRVAISIALLVLCLPLIFPYLKRKFSDDEDKEKEE